MVNCYVTRNMMFKKCSNFHWCILRGFNFIETVYELFDNPSYVRDAMQIHAKLHVHVKTLEVTIPPFNRWYSVWTAILVEVIKEELVDIANVCQWSSSVCYDNLSPENKLAFRPCIIISIGISFNVSSILCYNDKIIVRYVPVLFSS